MLSKISQRKKNTVCFYLYVESKKQNKQIQQNKLTHRYREQTSDYWRGEGSGER